MTPTPDDDFRPPRYLANPHLQSMLASSALRCVIGGRRVRRLERDAEAVTLDCGAGVRLTGRLTAQRALAHARGTVVLFHGWEGSVRSAYILRSGARLLAEGWDVFRLNFRDHGGTHALNRGLFHSCRIDEVVGALDAIQHRCLARPLTLVGFSLGGNFALRAALAAPAAGIRLARTIAVCPVIDPHSGLFQLEHAPRMYHDYFMWKWRRSLTAKQRAFPDVEWFTREDLRGNLRTLTDALVRKHTTFGSLDRYLDGYSVAGRRLLALTLPVSILASLDDPVCPAADYADLALPECAELTLTAHGGHCGFIRDGWLASWAEDFIAARLARSAVTDVAIDSPTPATQRA